QQLLCLVDQLLRDTQVEPIALRREALELIRERQIGCSSSWAFRFELSISRRHSVSNSALAWPAGALPTREAILDAQPGGLSGRGSSRASAPPTSASVFSPIRTNRRPYGDSVSMTANIPKMIVRCRISTRPSRAWA